MSAEFLVASLWVVVLGYWLWTRRPTTSDTVGLFKQELRVLEFAAPTRVPPANRMCDGTASSVRAAAKPGMIGGPGHVRAARQGLGASPAAAALPAAAVAMTAGGPAAPVYKRAEVRRRRRDVLSVLVAMVAVTVIAAALSRSTVAIAVQACCDLAMFTYVYLLLRATRVRRYGSIAYLPTEALVPPAPRLQSPPPILDIRSPDHRAGLDIRLDEDYVPAHSMNRSGVGRTMTRQLEPEESYGDFDSYASLALVR